ncbi:MAG: alpha/beta hydrolase [Prochlorococcaceae cyanobacterium]
MPAVISRLLSGAALAAALLLPAPPATAGGTANLPVRWNTGGAVWSTTQAAVDTFLETGVVTDRGLQGGIDRSGWSAEELRSGLTKTYEVSLVGVGRFLSSAAGETFLKDATRSYFPYWSMTTYAVQALRAAITADARDGSLSAVGIMRNLPVDFRLADFCNTYSGAQAVCDGGRCQQGTPQCTSLLSWFVSLPGCIQAHQLADPLVGRTAPPPAQERSVPGLW